MFSNYGGAMKGVAVVTGGNRGIGAAIALAMAERGYHVKIMCRSGERARTFIEEAAARRIGSIEWIAGDLGSIAGARDAAERIKRECPNLSVFIHNAGMWPLKLEFNEDGLEQSFVTNHLGPFIMNILLEDLFTANRCRLVQVSAGLYLIGMKDYEAAAAGTNFSILRTYATTKLFNLICTMQFARLWEGKGVTFNAVHPGVVRTGLGDTGGALGLFLRCAKLLQLTPEEGARAPLRLADNAKFSGVTGKYFDRFREKDLAPIALDGAFNEGLREQAMKLGFGR